MLIPFQLAFTVWKTFHMSFAHKAPERRVHNGQGMTIRCVFEDLCAGSTSPMRREKICQCLFRLGKFWHSDSLPRRPLETLHHALLHIVQAKTKHKQRAERENNHRNCDPCMPKRDGEKPRY